MKSQVPVTARRQRRWADLTFLEQAIARQECYLGPCPRHWERARALLWRDFKALAETPYALGGDLTDRENML